MIMLLWILYNAERGLASSLLTIDRSSLNRGKNRELDREGAYKQMKGGDYCISDQRAKETKYWIGFKMKQLERRV